MQIETPFGPPGHRQRKGELTAFGFGQPKQNGAEENPEVARQTKEYSKEPASISTSRWPRKERIPATSLGRTSPHRYGETISYAELAKRIGHPGAAARSVEPTPPTR